MPSPYVTGGTATRILASKAGCGPIPPARRAWSRATTAASGWTSSNMPQPDVFLIVQPEHGGQVRISEDDYIEGGPELVAEVAASSVELRSGQEAGRLSPERRPRIHRLAGARSRGRLVRPPRWAIRAPGAGGRRHPPQRGLPRPLARPGRDDRRRLGPGPGRGPARDRLRRACRFRRPTRCRNTPGAGGAGIRSVARLTSSRHRPRLPASATIESGFRPTPISPEGPDPREVMARRPAAGRIRPSRPGSTRTPAPPAPPRRG